MKLQDLGELDAPVFLFGGPYSNLQATQAAKAAAHDRQIPASHVICTGDILAYCGQPVETLSEIQSWGCAIVAGNCEKQLASFQQDCGCGFDEGTVCDRLSAGWYGHVDQAVQAADRDWMASLPDILSFSHQGLRCAVIHGGLRDISRFIWEVSEDTVFLEEIGEIHAVTGHVDIVISGHCGLPFQRKVQGVTWLNAGAIGMPPNDGRSETRYAVLSDGRAEIFGLEYDHVGAQTAMKAAGLIQGYDAALVSGYWPSEDVLPPELRRSALANG